MNAVIAFATGVAMTVTATLLQRLIDRPGIRASATQMARKAIAGGNKPLPKWLRFALNLFVFWFLISQLMALGTSKEPLTRMDVVLIAFWMAWLVAVFIQVALRRRE